MHELLNSIVLYYIICKFQTIWQWFSKLSWKKSGYLFSVRFYLNVIKLVRLNEIKINYRKNV